MPTPLSALCRPTCVALCAGIVGTALAAASSALALASIEPPPAAQPDAPPAAAPASPPAPPPAKPAAQPAPTEPEVVVIMNDGRRFSGFLIEKNALEVIIRVAGIRTTFKADAVDKVEILPPLLERYMELRKAIDDNDADQLIRLVDWLVARREFDLALTELNALLQRQPTHGSAIRARQNVVRQIELRDKARAAQAAKDAEAARQGLPAAAPTPSAAPAGDSASEPPHASTAFEPFPYLQPEDINLIRVFEIDLTRPPRFEVPRETITALLDRYAGHPALPTSREGREGVYRLPPREQLDLLFRVRARDLYPQVRVVEPPDSIRLFRDEIQRGWLTSSCATTACHGGADAGRLVLASKRPAADPALYTNFYILSKFKLADGTPLIDFQNPDRSPLLQMGLPREGASTRHPPVLRAAAAGGAPKDAWSPTFKTRDDRRFQAAIDWIKSLHQPRPDYALRYTPPRPFEAPAPAQKPSPGER